MNIDSIKNGIVIDHITAGLGMTVYSLLKLDELDCAVAIIKNAASRKMGKKDIIKIDADIELNMDILGYVDPGITVDIIKDSVLVEKKRIGLPEKLTGVYKKGLETESVERCVCDFVSGMSDRFAIESYRKLFIPEVWRGPN